jgi:hypothetical protein
MSEPSLSDLSITIQASPGSLLADGAWRIRWTIENHSSEVLSLREMRIPHDQFRAHDVQLDPALDIPPDAVGSIGSTVLFAEPPGSMLVYPFVIVRATWNGLACRLFGRLRVEADQNGAPHATCEEVTVQPVTGGQ